MSDSYDTGWYGKLPASGDFATRRLPPSFIEPWDAWLNAMLPVPVVRLFNVTGVEFVLEISMFPLVELAVIEVEDASKSIPVAAVRKTAPAATFVAAPLA